MSDDESQAWLSGPATPMKTTTRALALGFWLWCAAIAIGGGFLGSLLACDESDGCRDELPSWFEPWTWGDHDVYPAALIMGAAGLVAASGFVVFVFRRERLGAGIALVCSLVLLSYPFFAGLTFQGRVTFGLGALLGIGALAFPGATGARTRGDQSA